MLMKKISLLMTATALLFSLGAQAQQNLPDITSQYLTNPSFENCTPVEITTCTGYGSVVHGDGYSLIANSSSAAGYDYATQSWTLVEQLKNANGGVVTYNNKVQYSKSGYESTPTEGPNAASGTNALCFVGNGSLVYQQPEITLPAGTYCMTVNIWPYNGAYSHDTPTMKIKTFSGFLANDGTEYFNEDNRSDNKEITVNCNAWNQEKIYFELTKATTGHFQVSYGTQYFLVVDDITLEGETGVVTSALEKVIASAIELNARLRNNTDLATAIGTAETFVQNPTNQDDVTTQVETLYAAMSAALTASTGVVDLTDIYLENPSFEAFRMKPWAWTGTNKGAIDEPLNADSKTFIDGNNIAEFTTAVSNGNILTQTISHLPVGFYALAAKMNTSAYLILGASTNDKVICTGGKDPIYLYYHPNIYEMKTPGDLIVGAFGSGKYRVDDFHLFYAKDEASLQSRLLSLVKADAQTILANDYFKNVTGSERTAVQNAINGTDDKAINTNINTMVTALDSYNAFIKAKGDATNYDKTAYPYASETVFTNIQTIVNTDATSAGNAETLTQQLKDLYFQAYVSNAYCEGVEKTDYTANIIDANATAEASRWATQNMSIIQLAAAKAWKNPKTQETDDIVYGTSTDYNYNTAEKKALVLKQTLSGLPAGKYVLSITMMGYSNLTTYVFFNSQQIGTMVGKGTASGGKYGAGWNDYTFEFSKLGDTDQPLQIQCTPTANYAKDLYLDNFRLYRIGDNEATGISEVQDAKQKVQGCFDLQGRRVAQPTKGLYIINGKKVVIK